VRLNRFLALAGISSRRGAEEYIRNGRVTINGELITDLAKRVSPSDQVRVDGRAVQRKEFIYLLLNKPADFITTRSDEGSRKTIYTLLPENLPGLAHVGRLDKESEGLLLLTNDGDLAFQITHPKFKLEKEYLVTLDREFQIEDAPKTGKSPTVWAWPQLVDYLKIAGQPVSGPWPPHQEPRPDPDYETGPVAVPDPRSADTAEN